MNASLHELADGELKCLQKIELEMLIEIDRICRKYGIEYFLDGGTLLGAIRHKGFIPWDDDSDVIMLRREYKKFKKACEKELDKKRFFLQDYKTDPYYRWGYAKLRRNETEFVRAGQEDQKYHGGVYLDLFVVDNVPDGWLTRRIHHFLCFLIKKGLYSEIGKKSERNPIIRSIYKLMSRIPRDTYFEMRNCLARPLYKKKTELISHYTYEYPKRCRYGLPRECFDESIDAEFEGHMFKVFKNYDLYLSRLYGDYMKLPPKEDQVPKIKLSSISLLDPSL